MTQETLKQANDLTDELKSLKRHKEQLENIPTDYLCYGSKVYNFYKHIPDEVVLKVKNIILENLQEQINRKTRQLEEL